MASHTRNRRVPWRVSSVFKLTLRRLPFPGGYHAFMAIRTATAGNRRVAVVAVCAAEVGMGLVAELAGVTQGLRVAMATAAEFCAAAHSLIVAGLTVVPGNLRLSNAVLDRVTYLTSNALPIIFYYERVTTSQTWFRLGSEFAGTAVRWWIDRRARVPVSRRVAAGAIGTSPLLQRIG